jgi:hypothetical protein
VGLTGTILRSRVPRRTRGAGYAAGLGKKSPRAGRFGAGSDASSCSFAGRLHGLVSQIAATLRSMHPDDPALHVSQKTICAMFYARARGRGLKATMTLALRQDKPRRGTRRRTRFVTRAKIKGNGAAAVLAGFTRQMRRLAADLAPQPHLRPGPGDGLTPGAGPTAEDRHLVLRSPCAVAARLRREHQRPASRQFLPNRADLRQSSQRDLDHIAGLLINRPRKTLGLRAPAHALAEETAENAAVRACVKEL